MREIVKNFARALLFCIRTLLNPFFRFSEVGVLCYHSVSDSAIDTAVSAASFKQHLSRLQACGYDFVSISDIAAYAAGEKEQPRRAAALTFDDGYADFETAVLPVLETFNAPAALFVLGDAERAQQKLGNSIPLLSPGALERVAKHPLVTIGYHSLSHKNLARCSPGEIAEECAPRFDAKYFAYPGGNHSRDAVGYVRGAYKAAFTIRPVLIRKGQDLYLLPRCVVTRSMNARDVRQRVSKAADWYYSITRSIL